jgi:hypothetical protein
VEMSQAGFVGDLVQDEATYMAQAEFDENSKTGQVKQYEKNIGQNTLNSIDNVLSVTILAIFPTIVTGNLLENLNVTKISFFTLLILFILTLLWYFMISIVVKFVFYINDDKGRGWNTFISMSTAVVGTILSIIVFRALSFVLDETIVFLSLNRFEVGFLYIILFLVVYSNYAIIKVIKDYYQGKTE